MQIKTYLLLFFLFLFSCAQENKEEVLKKSPPIGEPIKGEPIVSDSLDSNQTEPTLNKDLPSIEPDKRSDLEETIEEGLVINGVRKPQDENSTQPTIINNLPPLEENSGYERLDFRDLVNFTYEVTWEGDGQEFDFSAYSKRVPKRLREKSGLSIAVEGFMIPTIVDENNKVKEFLLLPDQMSCCFGQSPEANGWVVVSANEGVEVLMDQIIRATGTLTVEERWDEEFFVGLYHLDCNEITGPSL